MPPASGNTLDRLVVKIDGDLQGLMRDLHRAGVLTDRSGRRMAKSFDRTKMSAAGMGTVVKGLIPLLIGVGSVRTLRGIANVNARFQDLQLTLNTVFGSMRAGQDAMAFIQDFAVRTPFDIATLTRAMIQLQGAGIAPTERLLTTLGDAASATTNRLQTFEALVRITTRAVGGGLGLEELEQLVSAGIPVYQILERQIGVTRTEISELGQSAEGAARIMRALERGLDERFAGGMAAAANNLSVATSNMGIAANNLALAFGDTANPDGFTASVTRLATQMGRLFDQLNPLAEGFGGRVATGIDTFAAAVEKLADGLSGIPVVGKGFKVTGTGETSSVPVATLSSRIGDAIQAELGPIFGSGIGGITPVAGHSPRIPEGAYSSYPGGVPGQSGLQPAPRRPFRGSSQLPGYNEPETAAVRQHRERVGVGLASVIAGLVPVAGPAGRGLSVARLVRKNRKMMDDTIRQAQKSGKSLDHQTEVRAFFDDLLERDALDLGYATKFNRSTGLPRLAHTRGKFSRGVGFGLRAAVGGTAYGITSSFLGGGTSPIGSSYGPGARGGIWGSIPANAQRPDRDRTDRGFRALGYEGQERRNARGYRVYGRGGLFGEEGAVGPYRKQDFPTSLDQKLKKARESAMELRRELAEFKIEMVEDLSANLSSGFIQDLEDSLEKGKLSLKGFQSAIKSFVSSLIQKFTELAVINPILNSIFGGQEKTGLKSINPVSLLTTIGSFFGGGKPGPGVGSHDAALFGLAGGGRVNGPRVVGERGPEIFMPDSARGSIINKSAAMGMASPPIQVNNVFNIDTGAADSARAEIMEREPIIAQQVFHSVYDAVQRGGPFGAAIQQAAR